MPPTCLRRLPPNTGEENMVEMHNLVVELDASRDDAAGDFGRRLVEQFGDYHPVVTSSSLGRAELIVSLPAEDVWQAATTARALFRDLPVTRVQVETSTDFDRRSATEVPPLMSVTEVAERLGLTRAAVQRRIDTGALPAVRVGQTWAVPAAAVE